MSDRNSEDQEKVQPTKTQKETEIHEVNNITDQLATQNESDTKEPKPELPSGVYQNEPEAVGFPASSSDHVNSRKNMKSQALAKNSANIDKVYQPYKTKQSEGFYNSKKNRKGREAAYKPNHHYSVDAASSIIVGSHTTATKPKQRRTLGNRTSQMRTINTKYRRSGYAQSFHQPGHRQCRSTDGSRGRKQKLQRTRFKSYMNSTGPADYNLPTLWGTLHTSTSKMKSGPFFSIGMRCKTPILSKKHIQDLKGKGVPGSGAYNVNTTHPEGTQYSISKAKRFDGPDRYAALNHTFSTPENYNKSSYIFGKDSRFKYKKEKAELRSRAPGPGAYNSIGYFKTMEKLNSGFGTSLKISDQVYFKELQSSYVSKHAPGPGAYNSKHFFSEVKPGGKINPPSSFEYTRSNTTTRGRKVAFKKQLVLKDHDQFIQLKKKQGEIKFGTAPRIYDPIFFGSQNKKLFNLYP